MYVTPDGGGGCPVAEPVLEILHLDFDKVIGDDAQLELSNLVREVGRYVGNALLFTIFSVRADSPPFYVLSLA